MTRILKPGDTIGILGGGQLGRMMALAAARLGLECHIYCPDAASPAFRVAGRHTIAAYDDAEALRTFAAAVDVITYEFENVPAETARILSEIRPLRPNSEALRISQDRLTEKTFLRDAAGVGVAPFAAIDTDAGITAALAITGLPAIIKTRRFGYDGKGQAMVRSAEEVSAALAKFGPGCILEGLVPFALECSAIVVRGLNGDTLIYDIGENRHEHHILKETLVPGSLSPVLQDAAREIGLRIANGLDYVGVLGVELFLVRDEKGERLVVNEIAPRVHNSGHWTEDGAVTSQFENHIRAIAGWPLGTVERPFPTRMINLIGDEAHEFAAILADPDARLHLYGKTEARPGRKMGHVNIVSRPKAGQ